jgi:RNA polymerase sigma factor (sigma-70 family)
VTPPGPYASRAGCRSCGSTWPRPATSSPSGWTAPRPSPSWPRSQPDEDDSEGALADRIGYEDHGLEGIENVASLKPLIAELPARDRQILSLRFVANMTQSEIGEELGISQMHVSRLLTRTLGRLRRGMLVEE